MAQTLFNKLWEKHLITNVDESTGLLFIDRIFLHERTGTIPLKSLESQNYSVKNPADVFCIMDHIVDTTIGRGDDTQVPNGKEFIQQTRKAAHAAKINLIDVNDPYQGIVHVVSPELGIAQPGMTLTCPDSHTCSQGALGALAWGIGSSEAEHALVTKTLRVNKPRTLRVHFNGITPADVTAKDMIIYLISKYGAAGGRGYVVEFCGPAVTALSMESRLTLCNMAVEFSAFSGIIAVDDKTVDYLKDRPYTSSIVNEPHIEQYWRTFTSDIDAIFDQEIYINCEQLRPMITWGVSPQHAISINNTIPRLNDELRNLPAQAIQHALDYMDLEEGQRLVGLSIDGAFIGSCTNGRLSDLRLAASLLKGRKIAKHVKAICVPGSSQVKREAEQEGLDKIFIDSGFEWREAGCSMCFFAGGESFSYQARVISSTNRNFENRQGPKVRTHLANPVTVAACAIAGYIVDVREYLE